MPEPRERLRGRREAREQAGREEGAEDEDDLAADEPPQQDGRPGRQRGARRGRLEARLRPREVHRREQHRAAEKGDLDDERLPVGRLPQRRERGEVLDGAADPGADQEHHRREGDVGEARDDERERRDPQELGGAAPEDEQADQAADPDRAGRQVEPVEGQGEAARGGLRGVAGGARDDEAGGGREERPRQREQLGHRALGPLRPVDPHAEGGGEREESEHELQVEVAAPEGGHVHERHDRPDGEGRAQRELRGREVEVDGRRDERDGERHPQGDIECTERRAAQDVDERPGRHRAQHEEPDRAHRREEDDPARDQELGRRRRLAERRDRELRRRSGVRADGEGERAADGMPVGGDHAPVDQVPPFGDRAELRHERVGIRRRAGGRAGRHATAGRVRDRDDGEARLHRLAVGHGDELRRVVQDHARRRRGVEQRRVRPGRCRGRERRHDRRRRERASPHASARFPEPVATPTIATTRATPATTSATIARIEEEPPKDDFACTVGAGVSEVSGPLQSTIDPSE